MTARQESEAEWYRAIEIGMIEQEKLDDYRHEQELEVLRANLQELNRLLHATDETRRENLNMACRLARWRDLLLAERDESRKEIAALKEALDDMILMADEFHLQYAEHWGNYRKEQQRNQAKSIADARALLKEEPK